MTQTRPLRAYAEVSLGRQRSPQHDLGPHMVPYLRAANVKDGSLDLDDVKSMNFDPGEQKQFALCAGDVLVTEGSGSLAAVGASAVWSAELPGTVCFQNTLLRLRPRASTDPRFLAWWCRHAFADGLFASVATGANIFHVSVDRVRSIPMKYLPPAEQRAIAGYLDTETARIDALIAKKRYLVELVERRFSAKVGELCCGEAVVLRRVVERFVDYRGATPDKAEDGVPLVTATHIKSGVVDHKLDPVFVSHATYAEWMRRGMPRKGDVLMTMEAPLGEVAQVADERIALAQRVMLIQTIDRRCTSDYLAYALRSTRTQQLLRAHSTGSTAAGIKADRLKGLKVLVPDRSRQGEIVEELRRSEAAMRDTKKALQRQIDLLRERRQALITAAVTGDLGIRGVA